MSTLAQGNYNLPKLGQLNATSQIFKRRLLLLSLSVSCCCCWIAACWASSSALQSKLAKNKGFKLHILIDQADPKYTCKMSIVCCVPWFRYIYRFKISERYDIYVAASARKRRLVQKEKSFSQKNYLLATIFVIFSNPRKWAKNSVNNANVKNIV